MKENNWYTRYCFEQECNEEIPLPKESNNMDKNINLVLTPNEVQIIGEALKEMPAKMVLNLINNINAQIVVHAQSELPKDGEIKEQSNEE